MFSKDIGEYEAYITNVENEQLIMLSKPNATNCNWTNVKSLAKNNIKYFKDVLYLKKDSKNYCNKCYYIIGIYPKKISIVTFVATFNNEKFPTYLLNGKSLNDYVEDYNYY